MAKTPETFSQRIAALERSMARADRAIKRLLAQMLADKKPRVVHVSLGNKGVDKVTN